MNNLFNEQLFHKYLDKIELTQKHMDNITLLNQKLNNGELIAETSNYHHFEKVFLNTLLGYNTFTNILADVFHCEPIEKVADDFINRIILLLVILIILLIVIFSSWLLGYW